MRRIIELIDWAARVHFVGTMVIAATVWAATFFAASADGWDAVSVWLASLIAGACCAIIFIAFRLNKFSARTPLSNIEPTEIASAQRAEISPLKIIFDPSNPGRKFWSIEPMRDESGKQIPGTFWEYRALVKNTSSKTLRNVKVTVEAIGAMPTRPEPSQFDINKTNLIDLTPDEEALVLIRRWFNPPIVAGMLASENAYGPIKMIASADDVVPATKLFRFEPAQTPMIFEVETSSDQAAP